MKTAKSFPYPPRSADSVLDYLRRLYAALVEFAIDIAAGDKSSSSPTWPISSYTTGTLTASHGTVLVDATSAPVTVPLPTATTCAGRVYYIKKIDTSANAVIVDGNGSETIDKATTASLVAPYECLMIQSDGTEWWVL